METFIQLLLGGLTVGSVYALVALGFVLVFKATDVLNFSNGELLVLGSYLAVTIIGTMGFGFVAAAVLIVALMAMVGFVIYRGVMRRLIGQPLFTLVLVTIGLSILIRSALLILYGPLEKAPVRALPEGSITIAGIMVSYTDIIIFGAAIAAVVVFFFFFQRTRIGLQMRGLALDLEAAIAVGIDHDRVFAVAWIVGAALAGFAGLLIANSVPVIDLGLASIGLRAFPAAMLGGITSIPGAIVGGLLVGVFEQLGAGYFGGEWRDVIAFSIMLVVLMIRPYGLFGEPELTRV